MKVEIEKKEQNIHVYVTVKPRTRDQKMTIYTTNNILDWLKKSAPEHKFDKAKLLKEPTVLHNGLGPKHLFGEWIFELETTAAATKETVTTSPAPEVKDEGIKNVNIMSSITTKKTPTKTAKNKKKRTRTKSEV